MPTRFLQTVTSLPCHPARFWQGTVVIPADGIWQYRGADFMAHADKKSVLARLTASALDFMINEENFHEFLQKLAAASVSTGNSLHPPQSPRSPTCRELQTAHGNRRIWKPGSRTLWSARRSSSYIWEQIAKILFRGIKIPPHLTILPAPRPTGRKTGS